MADTDIFYCEVRERTGTGGAREARRHLREAVEAFKTNDAPSDAKNEGRFMLGRALFELAVDRANGRKEMEAACATYDAATHSYSIGLLLLVVTALAALACTIFALPGRAKAKVMAA